MSQSAERASLWSLLIITKFLAAVCTSAHTTPGAATRTCANENTHNKDQTPHFHASNDTEHDGRSLPYSTVKETKEIEYNGPLARRPTAWKAEALAVCAVEYLEVVGCTTPGECQQTHDRRHDAVALAWPSAARGTPLAGPTNPL